VFSWLAQTNLTSFHNDISPLFNYLVDHNLLPTSAYLGSVQFGTETFHATSNVTFTASNFALDLEKGIKTSNALGGVVPNLALTAFVGLAGVMALL
jgi:xyloglucan-specific endo-beta-1,4-glucanase